MKRKRRVYVYICGDTMVLMCYDINADCESMFVILSILKIILYDENA